MKDLKRILLHLIEDESGQDLIEYALVAAVIGLGLAATMKNLATTIGSTLAGIGVRLTSST